jgi:hypothetical protein
MSRFFSGILQRNVAALHRVSLTVVVVTLVCCVHVYVCTAQVFASA